MTWESLIRVREEGNQVEIYRPITAAQETVERRDNR